MFENMPVTKGPDRWKLAESLFSWDEVEIARPSITFHVDFNGSSALLTMRVKGISLQPDLYDSFHIMGIGKLSLKGKDQWVFKNAPVEVSFSTHDRSGMAQVKF